MKDPTAPGIKPIEPKAVTLNAKKSALLVLECWQLMAGSEYFAHPLIPGITRLLERARAAGVLIAFTLPGRVRELEHIKEEPHPGEQVYTGFNRRPSEPVFIPGNFDKFAGGQLQSLLSLHDINTLVLVGHKANMAILYTATRAVVEFNYDVVIPVDGIAATTDYEKEYTLYQFRAFPGGFPQRFTFTELDMVSFQ